MKQTYFSYLWCRFKIKTSVYAWTCDEQSRICEEHIRTFKHIQENLNNYYHAFNPKFPSWQHKKQVKEMDYTFMQYPYGGGGDSW